MDKDKNTFLSPPKIEMKFQSSHLYFILEIDN